VTGSALILPAMNEEKVSSREQQTHIHEACTGARLNRPTRLHGVPRQITPNVR
jgi:hypothetical protein